MLSLVANEERHICIGAVLHTQDDDLQVKIGPGTGCTEQKDRFVQAQSQSVLSTDERHHDKSHTRLKLFKMLFGHSA